MTYVMGEQVQLGLARESVRGTVVAPTTWIPARTPTGIVAVVEKAEIKETRGSGIAGQGSEISSIHVEGDLEFNVRNSSIGYIWLSLLGSISTGVTLGAYTHTFTRQLTGPQNPSLALALAQAGGQDYEYPMVVVDSLELNVPIDDVVNATATLIGQKENEHADYTPAFVSDATDALFRNHDVTIKFADTVSGLAAADPICLKEFTLNIANNAKTKMCIGEQYPTDILSVASEITGSFAADLASAETFYDVYKAGGYKAMEISMERDDMPVLGTSTKYPKMVITLDRVSFDKYTPDRPIDDIVGESVDFTAHFDETNSSAITVVLQNTKANYTS